MIRLPWFMLFVGVACCLPLGSASAGPAPHACTGRIIGRLRLTGCLNTKCEAEQDYKKLLTLTDLVPGKSRYEPKNVERAVQRLLKTGFFLRVTPVCHLFGTAARLDFKVVGNTFIDEVEITGKYQFFKSFIRKRLILRPGQVLNVPSKAATQAMERQAQSLKGLYEKRGFVETRIKIDAQPLGQFRLKLVVEIDKGKRVKVKQVTVRLKSLHGQFSPNQLQRVAKLSKGMVFTPKTQRETRKHLVKHYRKHGYRRVSVTVHPLSSTLRLLVEIDESKGQRFGVRFSGNAHVSDDDLLETLPFLESGVFTAREAEFGREKIVELYATKGFLFAEVALRFDRKKQDILYRITEHQIAEIRELRFVGRRSIGKDELLSKMTTKPWRFFDDGGFLQVQALMQDLARIRQYYRQRGFTQFSFALKGPKNGMHRSVTQLKNSQTVLYTYTFRDFGFTVRRDYPGDRAIYVSIPFHEGVQTKVQQLIIRGNHKLKLAAVKEAFILKKGSPYSRQLLRTNLERLTGLYQRKGYHQVEIQVRCRTERLSEAACKPNHLTAAKVWLSLTISEGPQLHVGEILVLGNRETSDWILVRDFPRTGQPFDRGKLLLAQRRLREYGFFRRVYVEYIGLDESPPRSRIAMVINVEEDTTQYVELSLGFRTFQRTTESGNTLKFPKTASSVFTQGVSQSDHSVGGFRKQLFLDIPDLLIVGKFEYIHKNLFGRAWEFRVPIEYGASFTSLFRLGSAKLTVINNRFLDSDIALRMTALGIYDRANEIFDKLTYGGEFEVSKELSKGLLFSVLLELQGVQTKLPDESQLSKPAAQINVTPRVVYNKLDNPIHPTKGYQLSASLAYLLADGDNFITWAFDIRWVVTARNFLTFAAYIRYADSKSFNSANLPVAERYTLGGGRNVRGYGNDAIGQYDSAGHLLNPDPDQVGGNTVLHGSIEMRFPIFRKIGIWGATFFDWGALAQSITEFNKGSFRLSAGLGLRYLVGNQIPIRLDVGFIIDRRCTSVLVQPLGDVSWECGKREPWGSVHLEILYPF